MAELNITGISNQILSGSAVSLERETGEEFSYALAQSAVEARATTSLNAHGATPSSTQFTGSENIENENAPQTNANTDSEALQNQTNSNRLSQTPSSGLANSPLQEQASIQNQLTAAPNLNVLSNVQPIQNHLTNFQVGNQQTDARIAQPLTSAGKRASKAALAAQQAPQKPQAPAKNEFTQLVAKKISERASSFELRLDPPELGRIEGKIRVSDDGKTVLALNFDNEATLDLFARDTEGLRLALSEAGVDADTSDFEFSLAEDKERSATLLETQPNVQHAAEIPGGIRSLVDVWT